MKSINIRARRLQLKQLEIKIKNGDKTTIDNYACMYEDLDFFKIKNSYKNLSQIDFQQYFINRQKFQLIENLMESISGPEYTSPDDLSEIKSYIHTICETPNFEDILCWFATLPGSTLDICVNKAMGLLISYPLSYESINTKAILQLFKKLFDSVNIDPEWFIKVGLKNNIKKTGSIK